MSKFLKFLLNDSNKFFLLEFHVNDDVISVKVTFTDGRHIEDIHGYTATYCFYLSYAIYYLVDDID